MQKLTTSLPMIAVMLSIITFSCQKINDHKAVGGKEADGAGLIKKLTTANSNPNIIFILADDMAWNVFGDYPGMNKTKAETPTLDSMAREGVTFMNYWTHPSCIPSRAALLTGKYAFRTGVGSNEAQLKKDEKIIQQYIKDKKPGTYATAVFGKWHIRPRSELNSPADFGVDDFAITYDYGDYYNWEQSNNGTRERISTYLTTHQVTQSANWIDAQNKPFFLWLTFNAPHYPFHLPPPNLAPNLNLSGNQADINANPSPYYDAAIKAMDIEIARLIASLTEEQKSNTLFIFTSDNGTPPDVARAPYGERRSKGTLYQGGINTPLIICGYGVTRKNVTDKSLVQAQDMFATIADVAGVLPEGTYRDGISFKPLFTTENAGRRTIAYSELFGQANNRNNGYAIRNNEYKLIELDNGESYFYNLKYSPHENENLFLAPLRDKARQNLQQLRDFKNGLR